MIKYLTYDEIDKKRWDECIDKAFNGMVYAKSWYLNTVAENWDALVKNDYEQVFPLTWRKKYGIYYLYQPVFTQQLGIFSKTRLNEEIVIHFIENMPAKFHFVEINLNTLNSLANSKYKAKNWLNHELDLINSYEKISRDFSTNLKRNISKSQKAGLTVTKGVKPEEIIRIFRENRGKGIPTLDDGVYQKLARLTYEGIYKGLVVTYGVYSKNNSLCAGVIFIRNMKKVIFLFSGLTEEGRELNAMAFLIDSFIREHAGQHLTLDFEGSNDKNLARFYKSFGSVEIYYPHLVINKLPFPHNVLFQIKKLLKR
ncbi:MAG: hypothetical protein R2750_09790 [Bacteroidales bacterium]